MWSRLRNWVAVDKKSPPEAEAVSVSARTYPLEITDANFDELVLDSDRLVVVDFWADWCQPCTIMSAHMGFLSQEFGDRIIVASLDVEENEHTPAKYGVQGLPTLIMFRDGYEIDRQMGVADYDLLQRRVERLLSPSASAESTLNGQADDAVEVNGGTRT